MGVLCALRESCRTPDPCTTPQKQGDDAESRPSTTEPLWTKSRLTTEPLWEKSRLGRVAGRGGGPHHHPVTGARRTRKWWRYWSALTVASIYFGSLVQALSGLQNQRPWNWVGMIVPAVLFAAALPILRGVQQKGGFLAPPNDDWQRRRAENAVVTAGALPPDADPYEWSLRLGRMRDVLRQARWSIAGMCAVIGGLVGAAAAEANGNSVALWALAIGLIAFAVVPFWWASRRLEATERVLGRAQGSL